MSRTDEETLKYVADLFGLDIRCGKLAYRAKRSADAEVAAIIKRANDPVVTQAICSYKCKNCGFYHVGKRGPQDWPKASLWFESVPARESIDARS